MLSLYRAWRVAQEDASGIALPSGRRILLPTEEARDFFQDRGNHFPALESMAEQVAAQCDASAAGLERAIAERLARRVGIGLSCRLCDRMDAAAAPSHPSSTASSSTPTKPPPSPGASSR